MHPHILVIPDSQEHPLSWRLRRFRCQIIGKKKSQNPLSLFPTSPTDIPNSAKYDSWIHLRKGGCYRCTSIGSREKKTQEARQGIHNSRLEEKYKAHLKYLEIKKKKKSIRTRISSEGGRDFFLIFGIYYFYLFFFIIILGTKEDGIPLILQTLQPAKGENGERGGGGVDRCEICWLTMYLYMYRRLIDCIVLGDIWYKEC